MTTYILMEVSLAFETLYCVGKWIPERHLYESFCQGGTRESAEQVMAMFMAEDEKLRERLETKARMISEKEWNCHDA